MSYVVSQEATMMTILLSVSSQGATMMVDCDKSDEMAQAKANLFH
jgi:hypothetical protein